MEYLIELRRRLLYCSIFTILVFSILCFYANPLYQLLARPLLMQLPAQNLIATKITATLLVPIKFSFYLSFFLLIPFFSYHLWSFVSPALYKKERKSIWFLLFPTVFLFYLGVFFAYTLVLPLLFHFFIKASPAHVQLLPDIGHYLDFVLGLMFAFGVAFEVPVVVLALVNFRICTIAQLEAARRYVIVLSFVLGMLLTPPDVLSQIFLAIPLWLLYELGLLLAKLFLARLLNSKLGV